MSCTSYFHMSSVLQDSMTVFPSARLMRSSECVQVCKSPMLLILKILHDPSTLGSATPEITHELQSFPLTLKTPTHQPRIKHAVDEQILHHSAPLNNSSSEDLRDFSWCRISSINNIPPIYIRIYYLIVYG